MDVRPTPPVTIEGGPGWQVDGPPPDVIGTDSDPGPRRRPSRAVLTAAALSALVGFVAATILAAWRHGSVADDIEAAALSVSVWSTGDDGAYPVALTRGRPTLRIPVAVANTGPREIELVSVRLVGSDVRTGDLGTKRLTPGTQARVFLVRSLDCAEPREAAPNAGVSRLAVRARTDAGEREVEVHTPLNTGLLSREAVIGMCGDLPPEEAVMTETFDSAVDHGVALLSLQVTNASRHRLTVERLRAVVPWLSPRFVDEQGHTLPLPLALPAGDFRTPRQPWGAGPSTTWQVAVAVPDCRRVPSSLPRFEDQQLLSIDVESDERTATVQLGGDPYDVLRNLVRSACRS